MSAADYEDPGGASFGGGDGGVWTDCDCPGPPPDFLLPPPPRPPILQPPDPLSCNDEPLPIETCDALPLIDASYRGSSPSFQTSAVIVLCSVLLGLLVFIAVILIWKHKRKVQNFLPCKNSPHQATCDVAGGHGSTAAAIYEDLHDVLPRHTTPTHHHHHHHAQLTGRHVVAPSIELIDVKTPPGCNTDIHYPSGYPISRRPPVFLCPSPGPDPYRLYHQQRGGVAASTTSHHHLYEELSEPMDDEDDVSEPPLSSEDEFAEDELSLAGEADGRRLDGPPPPPYREEHEEDRLVQVQDHQRNRGDHVPRYRRPHEPLPPVPLGNKKQHRSLDRRRQEFHEGMLLDALLQLYPRVGSVEPPNGHQQQPQYHYPYHTTGPNNHRRIIPSITHRLQCMGGHQDEPAIEDGTTVAVAPYESVPALMHNHHLATFRPHLQTSSHQQQQQQQQQQHSKPYSGDSAIGSDSGYSNHTVGPGGGGTLLRGSSARRSGDAEERHRRLSQISADLALT